MFFFCLHYLSTTLNAFCKDRIKSTVFNSNKLILTTKKNSPYSNHAFAQLQMRRLLQRPAEILI